VVAEHNDERHETARTSAESETTLIEKAFLMGVGAAVFAKDKAEDLAEELVRRGRMTQEDSESFVGRIAHEADEMTSSAKKTIEAETTKAVEGMGLASKADIERLEAELSELKELIASLRPIEGGSSDS